MKPLFADTGYWVAFFQKTDQLHARAKALSKQMKARPFVTTEMVLTEFLNWFASSGPYLRTQAAVFVERMQALGEVRIIPQTPSCLQRRWRFTNSGRTRSGV